MIDITKNIERWHQMVRSKSTAALAEMVAEDAVFESPVVHRPQQGKAITVKYLAAAMSVLNNDSFRYLNEWRAPGSAVLEFEGVCEGITINGVDMIRWNEQGQIVHFKVMVRPLKGMNKLHELMGRMLQRAPG
jgi:hypothetical protein